MSGRDGLPQIIESFSEEDDGWRADAACRGADVELWYPTRDSKQEDVLAAKETCRGCPVQMACLAYSLDTGQSWGIWGGYGERERRRLRRVLRPFSVRRAS